MTKLATFSEQRGSKMPLQSISMKLMSALAQAQGHSTRRESTASIDDLDLWLTFLMETGVIDGSEIKPDRCEPNHDFTSLD